MKIEKYLQETLLFSIIRSGSLVSDRIAKVFQPHKVNYIQALVLVAISREKVAVRPAQLQRVFGLSSGAISQNITHLERLKYIERKISPTDARGYELHLTRNGRAHADRLISTFEILERSIEKAIGPSQSQPFLVMLRKIHKVADT